MGGFSDETESPLVEMGFKKELAKKAFEIYNVKI
jgi:hypothetical protein